MPTLKDAGDANKTEPQAAPPNAAPDLDSLLPLLSSAATDPELRNRLRQSREFQGLVGQAAFDLAQKMREADNAEAAKAAQQKAETDMLELAKTDPEAFAQRYLSETTTKKTQTEVTEMRNSVLQEYGNSIGKAIQAIPEWNALTPEDNQRIMAAIANLPIEQVVPAYTAIAVEVIADKKAEAKAAKMYAERLPQEVKARVAEEAAKSRARQARPGIQPGAQTAADPEPAANSPEWDAWYERKFPTARKTIARPTGVQRK